MKITALAAIAALALPSAVVGGRCYTRKENHVCKNKKDIFKIIRGIDKDECKYLCTSYPGEDCYGYEYNYEYERCELHSAKVEAGGKKKGTDCYVGYDCNESSGHSATYTRIDGKACKAPSSAPEPRKIYGVNSDECKRICTRDPTPENPPCVGFEYGGDRNQPCELFSQGNLSGGKKKKGYNCWVKNEAQQYQCGTSCQNDQQCASGVAPGVLGGCRYCANNQCSGQPAPKYQCGSPCNTNAECKSGVAPGTKGGCAWCYRGACRA